MIVGRMDLTPTDKPTAKVNFVSDGKVDWDRSDSVVYNETNANVDHPNHYQSNKKYECIDVIRDATDGLTGENAFCLGNTIKYLFRCTKKGKLLEDLEKAEWYLTRLINNLNEE